MTVSSKTHVSFWPLPQFEAIDVSRDDPSRNQGRKVLLFLVNSCPLFGAVP